MIKRLLFFAYGVTSYLIFLGTFLYAIAFVGGFVVPTRLDGPLETSLPAALAIDAALLAVFAVQHSVMARRWFKSRWTLIVPWAIERSTYVLCASAALLLLFWQWRPIGTSIWTVEHAAARVVLWTLGGAGWATVLAVTFLINHFDLFGLRQVWLPLVGRPYTRVSFRTPLPYRFVRHPLYFGFLVAFWATPTMTLAHLVFAVATTAYIALAIQFEERDLVAEHGAAYEQYRRTVPMLLPGRARSTTRRTGVAAGMLALTLLVPSHASAQQAEARTTPAHHEPSVRPFSQNELVTVVRESTARFRDVSVARAEGYALLFGCVSGPDWGAMGLHFVNLSLVGDGVLDATRPEIVIYEPQPDGSLKLVGADYLVFADAWHQAHAATPELGGQLLHLFDSPNRFGLPPFYTLHVWAWKPNPDGTFVNWHRHVSCDAYSGRTP